MERVMSEYLLLKWGTIKGWDFSDNESAKAIAKKYIELGASASAMAQSDTPEQKQLICDLINACNGVISNDWSGETLTKEQAIEYVTTYGRGE
jgi:hypothetical protein